MKHHYPVRALSLLCALAIFVSLIPAALAAAPTMEQLEKYTVQDTVTPAGIQINLFDYWVTSQTKNDTGDSAQDNTGINKDHHLRFTNRESGAINAYTHSAAPRPEIVQNQLKDGYPVLTAGKSTGVSNLNNGQTTEESLAYLFDQSEQIDATTEDGTPTGTLGKKTYWDVGGLLQIDRDGYYYYNADYSKSKVAGGSYQSANYAYFDEGSKTFKVYDTWGIKKIGAGNQQGQFFPFTNPSTANVFTVDDNGNLAANTNTDSNSNGVSHFFGVSMTTRFIQRYGGMTSQQNGKAMTFEFAGDDDVWIFIDGVLVADLGGIHDQATTTINFVSGDIIVNTEKVGTLKSIMSKNGYNDASYWNEDTFADNTYHTLKLFYLERGGTDSNLAMKFNLAYVPETDGIKVDQFGTRLNGVEFDLYAATKNTDTSSSERYVIDHSKGADGLLATGTTDSGGRFVLNDDTGGHISLNELTDKHHVEYLILQERPEGREGYRRDENIYLVLTSNDTVSILFNDMEHRWTTGTYAGLKGTVSTSESVQLVNADRSNYVPGTAVTDEDRHELISTDGKAHLAAGGKLFAVIMRRLDNVGQSKPSATDEWGVVTGSALSGWRVYERGTGQAGYREAVIRALRAGAADNGNAVAFKLTTNGAYMAELKNCPGDLREYYYWTGKRVNGSNEKDTAYTVAFYYTTASKLSQADEGNTYWVDGEDFERQFAATIYIPNVKHYLNVQKLDDNNDPVNGVTFALYKKDDLTITDTGWSVKEGKSAYDTVTTDENGKAQFPSTKDGVLAEGQYYLVENSAPEGYKVNATAVPILVDDEHGVMADAGTPNDGVAVTVAEGHLVPTMTPFATADDIDRTLTNITSTKKTAASGWANTSALQKTGNTVDLTLDTKKFDPNDYANTLRYIPVDSHNEKRAWDAEEGWLWFHIEQTPIVASDPDKNLKTDLGDRDLTRLFTGETTVTVTDQRIGSLAVTKNVVVVDDTSSDRPDPDASYRVTVTLALDGKPINDAVACEDSAHELQSVLFENGKAVLSLKADQTITFPDLPAGTVWTVKETETLSSDRWRTAVTVNGQSSPLTASGTIARADRDAVVITNRYAHYDKYAAAVTEQFKVRKIYTTGGEHSIYPGRVSFVLKDANGSAIQTIFVDGDARAEFDALTFDHAGTYTYTVEEVNGLVDGMHYDPTVYTVDITVTENDAEHRLDAAVTWRDNAYDAEKGLTFTNTYVEPKGSLSIKKTVNIVDNSTETPNLDTDTYPIVVTLTNGSSHITGAVTCTDSRDPNHTSVTFDSDGKATLSLKHNQTITLTGLPVGTTWTVCEGTLTNAERWDTTVSASTGGIVTDKVASGTISTTGSAVNITNTYDYAATPTKAEATIKVSKQYGAQTYGEPVQFTITGINGTATPNPSSLSITGANSNQFELTFNTAGTYTYTIEEVKTPAVSGMTYAETVYTVTFNVARGTGSDRNKLVATPTYTVVEKPGAASNSYLYTDTTGLLFTNTYNPGSSEEQDKGSLSIKKTLENPKNATTGLPENYEIKITLSHYDGISSSSQIGSSEPQSVTLTFTGGEATYYIQAGETLTLSDLPVGTQWTVTETAQLDSKYWRTAYKVNGQDATTVSDEISAANETDAVIITNTYDPNGGEIVPGGTGALSISKEIGEGIDPDTTFDFLIEVNGASGSYDATQNGTASSVTFTDGKATVQLKGGETLLIKGLPDAALYTIQETTTGYTVAKTGDTGTLSGGQTAKAHFTNTKSGSGENPKPNPEPAPEPGDGGNGGTPALNRRDHYAYIIGYPDGDVHPQGNITRAEVATIFFRLLRDPVRTQYWSQTNGYSDVPGNKWYNNAISTLSNMGIICGYPDGTFRPDAPITRAELTKIAAGFFSDPRVAATYDGRFSDVHGAEWYISYLMTALEEGLIEGYPDGSFRPNRPITRAETCTIVNRTLGRKPEKDHLLPESDMINWPDNINRNIWYYAQMQEATNSHDYRWTSVYSEVCEQWTAKLAERDWAALERTWSHANSAPGGEVMQ